MRSVTRAGSGWSSDSMTTGCSESRRAGKPGTRRWHRPMPAMGLAGLLVGLASVALSPAVQAATIYVSTTGADTNDGKNWATAKQTVTAGLSAAVSGDQVWVAAGTYVSSNLGRPVALVKSGVALYGGFAGNETQLDDRNWTTNVTILDGEGTKLVVTVLSGAVAGTRVDGFVICRGSKPADTTTKGGGIYCGSSTTSSVVTIANNLITGNTSTYGGGIYCSNTVAVISNNTIVGNGATWGGGIYCDTNAAPTIVNNTIVNNVAATGGGIYCNSASSTPTIANNIVAFNSSGIHNEGGAPVLHTNCLFNPTGVDYSGLLAGSTDMTADPQLAGAEFSEVHLKAGSPCIDAGDDTAVPAGSVDLDRGNRIQGTHVDIGVDEFNGTPPAFAPRIVRVAPSGNDANDGSSWAQAKLTVQAGIDAAAGARGEVWVAAGTYNERITLKPMAYVYGGFAGTEDSRAQRAWKNNATILDGGAGGSVVSAFSGRRVSGIDGFTIRNGTGTLWNSYVHGGGVYCAQSSPFISNNTISGNTLWSSYGAAIACVDRSSPLISNNVITSNSGAKGSGIYCDHSHPIVVGNTITGNTANSGGGGIYCSYSAAFIANNVLNGNIATPGYGGAVYFESSFPTIIRNTIRGNTATLGGGIYGIYGSTPPATVLNNAITDNVGGGVYCGGGVVVSGNIIAGNTAYHKDGSGSRTGGGGVYCDAGSPTVSNNTIVRNSTDKGAGIYCSLSGSPVVSNNIVAFNTSGIYSAGGVPTLRSNCVYQPGWTNYAGVLPGSGDFSVDPLLLDADFADVHLKSGSPCIDAGFDDAVQTGSLDIDGEARIQGSHVDIGADEFNGVTPAYTPTVIRVSPSGNDTNDGSSWALAKLTVQAGIDTASSTSGEVWVAAGTYNERITLKSAAYVYGGFAGTEMRRDDRDWTTRLSILDGNYGGIVVTVLNCGISSRLDGITIRNGFGSGGGVFCSNASPIIANNTIVGDSDHRSDGVFCDFSLPTISGNTIKGQGMSGIFCQYSDPLICDNIIVDSSLYGICCAVSSPTISNNRISGTKDGSGVYFDGAGFSDASPSGLISNNVITGNISSASGAGIYCKDRSPTILNNTIAGNRANGSGGGIYSTSPVIIANNALVGNCAGRGGAIYCQTKSPTITNNTVLGNSATKGGGIYCTNAGPTISNNIIAFNTSGIEITGSAQPPALRNNCFYNPDGYDYYGVTAGSGDILADPQIQAVNYAQIHLKAGSPCIDAGLDDALQSGWADIDGQPRIQGTHVDIGADEFNGATPEHTPTIVRVGPSGDDANDGSSWPSAKRTVQAGLDAAFGAGGEVWVAAGTYYERIVLRPGTYLYGGFAGTEDSRNERGRATPAAILDGGGAESYTVNALSYTVNAFSGHLMSCVDGLTIRNGYKGGVYCPCSLQITNNTIAGNTGYGGIHCDRSAPIISNNIITTNRGNYGGGGGVYCYGALPTISNNVITGNTDIGIYCYCSSPMILNNTIVGSTASSGGGIVCSGDSSCSSSPTILNNIVAFNSVGIRQGSGVPTLGNNCVYNPAGPNYTGLSAGNGDISSDPKLEAVRYGQVHLAAGSPCIDAGSDSVVQSDWVDMDGEPRMQVVHVDIGADEFNGATPGYMPAIIRISPSGNDINDGSSWTSAKRTVQAGIDAASTIGGEVWVAAGTYNERISLKPWAYVYGGFAGEENSRDQRSWAKNVTILDGSADGSVVTASFPGCGSSAIDGFTIRNGIGTMSGSIRYGGGIYCYYASPMIANDIITANSASGDGGGIFCYYSSPTIADTMIVGNTASNNGGGICCYYSSPVMSNDTATGNITSNYGGGVYCSSSSAVISNSTISLNRASSGGGMYFDSYSSLAVSDCRIAGNVVTDSGGGFYCNWSSSARIVNVVFAGNKASNSGGGMYASTSSLTQCTLSGNSAFFGAGFSNSGGSPSLTNCILWGNDGPAITKDGGSPTLTYCDVQGGWTGTGNIDIDPKFVRSASPGGDGTWGTADDDYGDFRLQAGSPCIDAGSNAATVTAGILTDLDGHGRFFDDPGTADCPWAPGTCGTAPIVDMGAYEFIAGDYDRDGDVDTDDLAAFLGCVSGPAIPYAGNCIAADFDRDGDVDQGDFGVFQKSFSGAKEEE